MSRGVGRRTAAPASSTTSASWSSGRRTRVGQRGAASRPRSPPVVSSGRRQLVGVGRRSTSRLGGDLRRGDLGRAYGSCRSPRGSARRRRSPGRRRALGDVADACAVRLGRPGGVSVRPASRPGQGHAPARPQRPRRPDAGVAGPALDRRRCRAASPGSVGGRPGRSASVAERGGRRGPGQGRAASARSRSSVTACSRPGGVAEQRRAGDEHVGARPAAAPATVAGPMPPSTSRSTSRPRSTIIRRISAILGSMVAM